MATPPRSPSTSKTPTRGGGGGSVTPRLQEIVVNALHRMEVLLKDSDRKHTTLRRYLYVVTGHINGSRPYQSHFPEQNKDTEMSFICIPIRYALYSGDPAAVLGALEALEKLFAHGYLTDAMKFTPPDLSHELETKKKGFFSGLTEVHNFGDLLRLGKSEAAQATNVVLDITPETGVYLVPQAISWLCINAHMANENVQVAIARTLQTALNSPNVNIHGHTFLVLVKGAFSVFLSGVSEAVHDSARTSLTQTVSVAFRRVEQDLEASVKKGRPHSVSLVRTSERKKLRPIEDTCHSIVLSIIDSVLGPSEGSPSVVSPPITNKTKTVVAPSTALTTPAEMLATATRCQEIVEYSPVVEHEASHFHTESMRDAFLLLRGLCRISMRPLPAERPEYALVLQTEIRCKRLSLDLLQNIVGHTDTIVSAVPEFVHYGVKNCVAHVVLENSLCSSIDVNRGAFLIFWDLLAKFRDSLKKEIGVMLTAVVAQMLESSSFTFQQKELVVGLLRKIAEDPQVLCDLFVNYDCDISEPNVYEGIVGCLSKVTTGSHVVANWFTPKEEKLFKGLAVDSTLTVLRSLIAWVSKFEEMGNGGGHLVDADTIDGGTFTMETPTDGALPAQPSEDEFARDKRIKAEMAEALANFSAEPKKTVKQMLARGLLPRQPEVVAHWLKTTKGLDRVAIGEALSASDDFGKTVLQEYIEFFNFAGVHIDEALRILMASYKICGEAQVIDRTMLFFSAKYVRDNPECYFTPDAAYVTAFSIMMLSTDLYNPNVAKKDKMKKEQFVQNFSRAEDCKAMPKEVFEGIYDRIAAKEITLDGGNGGNSSGAPTSSPALTRTPSQSPTSKRSTQVLRKLENAERANILLHSKQLFRHSLEGQEGQLDEAYFFADRVEHVKPMWEISNGPALVAFITSFDTVDNEDVRTQCLQGLEKGIHLSCAVGARATRDTYVSALLKLTNLRMFPKVPIYPRHARAVRTLLTMAAVEGNALRGSWYEVLKCVSYLHKNHFIGAEEAGAHLVTSTSDVMKTEGVDEHLVDRLFTLSMDLSGEAIVYFVENLCRVCKEEIDGTIQPRLFSLQKIAEIAEWNMKRIQVVWTQIWAPIGAQLTSAGLHTEIRVSMYAVDSLRQLAVKFMEREELLSFHFQREFMKPFESIFSNTKTVEIRELVLRCLLQIIAIRGTKIMSGWKSILACLSCAASDKISVVMLTSFEAADQIVSTCLHYLANPEHFTDLISCMIAFSFNTQNELISRKAILYLDAFSRFLKNGIPMPSHPIMRARSDVIKQSTSSRALEPLTNLDMFLNVPMESSFSTSSVDGEDVLLVIPRPEGFTQLVPSMKGEVRVWLAIFTGYCTLITTHANIAIREAALIQHFHALRQVGSYFSTEVWGTILSGAVFPIFDNVFCDTHLPQSQGTSEREWQIKAITIGLEGVTRLFYELPKELKPHLSDILQNTFINCIRRYDDIFTDVSLKAFENFLVLDAAENVFASEDWDTVCRWLGNITEATIPRSLTTLSVDPNDNTVLQTTAKGPTGDVITVRFVAQTAIAKLRSCVKVVSMNHSLTASYAHIPTHSALLAECIRSTNDVISFCFEFGRDITKIDLIQHYAKDVYVTLLDVMAFLCVGYSATLQKFVPGSQIAEDALQDFSASVLEQWVLVVIGPDHIRMEATVLQPAVYMVLDFLAGLEGGEGQRVRHWVGRMYHVLCSMIGCGDKETSYRLSAVMRKIGREYGIGPGK